MQASLLHDAFYFMTEPTDTDEPDDIDFGKPSKCQRKREADAILDFARTLGEISDSELAQIDLPEDVAAAVQHLRQITARSAGKRQLHFVAKQLRKQQDLLPQWQAACEQARLPSQLETQAFHSVERWRSRLLDTNQENRQRALTEFKDKQPQADIQQLRQMIRNHDQQRSDEGKKRYSREIFRWLRASLHIE